MSPLKISMLVRLYCRAKPFETMPAEEVTAPAMLEAFCFFREHGLLTEETSWAAIKYGRASFPFLSDKGLALVDRLLEVQP